MHGRKTSITLKTMNGENHKVLHGIGVPQSLNESEEKVWVQSRSTYAQEDLPVNNREIATAEKLNKWKYLNKFILVMSVDDNQEVSLLIGAICVRALEPREVISSQNGGPLKTLLKTMHLRHY